ncbi:MAG TPA: TetR/AcrR family transcriptional regulator [Chloroflexota bacterium]|nr:TetR/AcrR family transcriptional regulator [Chloroflexota bacterium]
MAASEVTKRPAGIRTREAILESSKILFLRQGYHATGMREIARESGISLSAVYNHFSSKEEILQELLSDRNLYQAIGDALARAEGDSVADLVESGFLSVMADLKGREEFGFLVFMDILEFQGAHVAALAGQAFPGLLGFFQRVALLGRQRGELRDISPLLLGRTFIGAILTSFIIENVMGVLNRSELRIPLHVDNWERGMVDILLNGILTEPARIEGDGSNG